MGHPSDRAVAVAAITDDAEESARVYVVAEADTNVILHGVSVFAHRNGVDVNDVLRRFPFAPSYVTATVGRVRDEGFEVLATGANVDHFDIQLIPARTVDDGPADRRSLVAAASRVLDVAGELRPNPAYAGPQEEP
jgi:hypothetical protein